MLIAGVVPGAGELTLPHVEALGEGGLARREFGVINIGETGEVVVDGEPYELAHRDGLYIGRGSTFSFRGEGSRFYVVSADRKSTRLNSSHGYISYAVFCLKKKKKNT